MVVFPWPFFPTSAILSPVSREKLMLSRISLEPAWIGKTETFLNSKPLRIGRGTSMASGFEKTFGRPTEKNCNRIG